MAKFFVRNLAYTMTDADLRRLFEPFGSVVSAKIIIDREMNKSKGFGFVEMGTDEEAVAAIEGVNGQNHGGRTIAVSEARPARAAAAEGAAVAEAATAAAEAAAVAAGMAVVAAAEAATAAVAAAAAVAGVWRRRPGRPVRPRRRRLANPPFSETPPILRVSDCASRIPSASVDSRRGGEEEE